MRSQFAGYIQMQETREAYHHLLKLVDDSRLTCKYRYKKPDNKKSDNKRSCNFCDDDGNIPYAFIVNRRSLTFYFRKYALIRTDRKKLEENLREDFGDDFNGKPNQGTEYHVKLRCVVDVDRLVKYLDW